MRRWQTVWELLRDVGLTGFGAWIIWRQVLASPNVSVPLIILGGGLMVPAGRASILALLPILLGSGESSSSSPPPSELPPGHSSPQEGGTGEQRP